MASSAMRAYERDMHKYLRDAIAVQNLSFEETQRGLRELQVRHFGRPLEMPSAENVVDYRLNQRYRAIRNARQARKNYSQLEREAWLINKLIATKSRLLQQMMGTRFKTQGASGDARWRDLHPKTKRNRKRQGFAPGPILIRSGTLASAVVNGAPRYNKEKVWLATRKRAMPRYVNAKLNKGKLRKRRNGVDADYANTQAVAFALSNGTGNIPARPFLHPATADELKAFFIMRRRLVRIVVLGAARGLKAGDALAEAGY